MAPKRSRSRSARGSKKSSGKPASDAINLEKVEPPTGPFGQVGWPYLKSAFMHADNNMSACTFKVKELKPKKMAGNSFGWQGGGGNSGAVHTKGEKTGDVKLTCTTSANALVRNSGSTAITPAQFLKDATAFPLEWELIPCEFSTGSFGWHCHKNLEQKLGDKTVTAMVNFNAIIFKSGDERYTKEEDPALRDINPDALKEYMPDIVPFYKKEWKKDLQKICGIGPWIEKRLNKIKIFSCHQLREITPELEDKINEAIKYFPGRVKRDEWKFQAMRIVDGKFDQLKGLTLDEHAYGKVKINGTEYEKKLVALADETMQDGKIELFEAEALFWLAERIDGVSASEKTTLEYIYENDKYKFEDEAALYFRRKLDGL